MQKYSHLSCFQDLVSNIPDIPETHYEAEDDPELLT